MNGQNRVNFLGGECFKRLLVILLLAMLILSGCAAKEEDIVFTAVEIELLEDVQPTGSAYRKLTPEQAKENLASA